MRNRSALVLIFLAVNAFGGLTPTVVNKRIDRDGPSRVLNGIYNSESEWRGFTLGVSSGRASWLRVAVRLAPARDAAPGQQLTEVVAAGLASSPENVLRIALPTFSAAEICVAPDVDDRRYATSKAAFAELRRRQQMVSAVHVRELLPARDACLASLRAAEKPLGMFFRKH